MDGDKSAAEAYRKRAEEVRVIAEMTRDKIARDMLLTVANDYEHMARTREAIARSDITRSKRQ